MGRSIKRQPCRLVAASRRSVAKRLPNLAKSLADMLVDAIGKASISDSTFLDPQRRVCAGRATTVTRP